MKTLLILLLITTTTFAQSEGQSFCKGDTTKDYFTLQQFPKYVIWYKNLYTETAMGAKTIGGKSYEAYLQEWMDGSNDTLHIREEGSRVYQYNEKTKKEVIRYDSTFKIGKSWKGIDVTYTLLSKSADLKTPVCEYQNLMSVEAKYPTVTYVFYYLKGFGYVGASKEGKLISFATPELPEP